jgi:hypothetical protein
MKGRGYSFINWWSAVQGKGALNLQEKRVHCLFFFFGRNINKLQAVVRCYSKHHQYGRARKAVTAMQASYRRWHLVFLLNENRGRRGTLLKRFRARLACKVERHKLKLFNKLFEEVRNYFLMRTSDRLQHQLFFINRKIQSLGEY